MGKPPPLRLHGPSALIIRIPPEYSFGYRRRHQNWVRLQEKLMASLIQADPNIQEIVVITLVKNAKGMYVNSRITPYLMLLVLSTDLLKGSC